MVDFMKNSGSSVIKEKTLGGGEGGSLDMETSDCRGDKGGLVVQQEQQVVVDVEEGEISSDSCEEISEEAFKTKPPSPTLPPPLRRRVSGGSTGAAASVVVNVSSNASGNNPVSGGGGGKLWTMKDVYSNFRIAPKTSYSGLYNLAWAQAVNNKPLDEVFVMMEDTSAKENNSGGNDNSRDKNLDENKAVTDEGDKEDGELEEGEIDLDSDSVVGNENSGMGIKSEMMRGDGSRREVERRKRVDSIKKSLESLTFADAGKSFDGLCASFKKSVENLQKMMPEGSFAEKDDLVQLLLNAIRNLHSALSSMTPGSKERDRSIFLRLLTHVTSLKPSPFTSLQLKELEVILSSVDSLTNDGIDRNKQSSGSLKKTDWGTLSDNPNKESARKREIESRSTASFGETENSISLDHSKPGSTVNSKQNKGLALPLLDLHKDHDADSLPSPTRELSAPLPFDKGFVLGQGLVKPEWPVPRRTIDRESYLLHPYETDAVKAVSSYQQKFGRTSIFMSDKLPSPTPSEEGDDTGDVEMSGEVSSSIVKQNVSSATVNPSSLGSFMNTSILSQPVVYSTSVTNMLVGQQFTGPRVLGSVSANTNPMLKPPSAKSRDPRLRLANSDVGGARNLKQNISSAVAKESKQDSLVLMSSRKQKTVEELVLDGPVSKRQRNEPTNSVYDVQAVTGTGGWLEDRGPVGIGVTNGNSSHIGSQSTTLPTTSANTSLPVISTQTSLLTNPITTVPVTGPYTLPSTGQNAKKPVVDSNTTVIDSLLRDIAVNPSIWMNILKMEHQKSSDNSKGMSQPPSVNSIQGAVPSTNASLPSSSVLGQISAGTDHNPTHAVSVEESGKIRMKPRDPRRLLYNNNAPEKGGAMGSDRPKVNESLMAGNNLSKQEDNSDKKSVLSSTTTMRPPDIGRQFTTTLSSTTTMRPPDIGRQFTTTLRSIADMLSVSSQVSVPSPASRPQIPSSSQQPVQGHHQVESGNQRNGSSSLASEEANGVPPRPLNANAWSDVEHLFDGFDDQQKAAIQRERSRRLDEQKKLFAARKLCLVLDLDHTLLNSAKFVEVDIDHDEILRKKEEQDREKPYRHIFRFPHMGMWTKLRPGIWNFLQKASKLFELHLYTMGNKYYATEMAKLLDPKGELFAGRVISRGDDGEPFDGDDRVVVPKSKDLEGVLGMESCVVIIDDSVRVWPHNKLNLIVVERYIYFPCSRRQFGLPGPSLLEIDHDERPEDGTLASSLAVIERIHQNFFAYQSLDEADVRNILACEQRKILSGCRIVFSRVFPVGEAKPHMHPLWQTAEQFGAVCTNQIDDQVTHVVANSLGTDKVNWALSKGKFVVHPGWVEASALLYRRANEHDFAIKQP